MEFQFDCECGATVSDFTRSGETEADFHMGCESCKALYLVTITQIRKGE